MTPLGREWARKAEADRRAILGGNLRDIRPGSPQAAIQLADRRTFESEPMSAARILVNDSATASRPEAGASSTATGVRSPMAMASPVWPK